MSGHPPCDSVQGGCSAEEGPVGSRLAKTKTKEAKKKEKKEREKEEDDDYDMMMYVNCNVM